MCGLVRRATRSRFQGEVGFINMEFLRNSVDCSKFRVFQAQIQPQKPVRRQAGNFKFLFNVKEIF